MTVEPPLSRRIEELARYDEPESDAAGFGGTVSALRAEGIDPMAIRLVLLAHHYRDDWEYTDADLAPGTYYYRVVAVDTADNASAATSAAAVRCMSVRFACSAS